MVSYHFLLAFLSLIYLSAITVNGESGVCYDSFQAIGNVDRHFAFLKKKFGAVRTYQTTVAGQVNLIDAAAKAGLQVAAGIWLRGEVPFADDLRAAIEGTKRNPSVVIAIYVGNEDLDNGWNATQVMDKIHQVRGAFAANGLSYIPIGTVQTDSQFLAHPEMAEICDVVGVNIYPFFDSTAFSVAYPEQALAKRYSAMISAYGHKVRLTETGWPSEGVSFGNHVTDMANARNYFKSFERWVASLSGNVAQWPFYFQFADVPPKGGFEAHFGLSVDGASWKFDVIPTPAPTPAPTTTTVQPTTTVAPTTTIPPSESSESSESSSSPIAASALITPEPSNDVNVSESSVTPRPETTTTPSSTEAAVTTPQDSSIYEAKVSSKESSSTSGTTVAMSVIGVFAALVVGFVAFRQYNRHRAKLDRDVFVGPRGSTLMTYQRADIAIL